MITPQLISYIRGQMAAGTPREIVIKALIESGWTMQDINGAFGMITVSAPASIPIVSSAAATNETALPASHLGGKILLSMSLISVSAIYAFFQHMKTGQQSSMIADTIVPTAQQQPITPVAASVSPQPAAEPTPAQIVAALPPTKKTAAAIKPKKTSTSAAAATPSPAPTPAPVPVPAPVPPPEPKGQYIDGAYTGSEADAYYGIIQVKAIISGGKLTDVKFLSYPNDRRTSIEINGQAMPYLKQEAIAAQSAAVDIVSGATDSSQAFQQSLGDALAQAKA